MKAAAAVQTAGDGASLEKLRARIVELKNALASINQAPRPASEVRAALVEVFKHAEYATSAADPFETLVRDIVTPVLPAEVGLGLLVYFIGAEELADRALKRLVIPAGALSMDERLKKRSQTEAQLLYAEREEEREILRLEAAGHAVLRREDASPEVLLAVWGEVDGTGVAR